MSVHSFSCANSLSDIILFLRCVHELFPAIKPRPAMTHSTECVFCNVKQVLKEISFSEPRIPVYSNVTGRPFESASEIAGMLQRQLVEPVMWERIMENFKESGKNKLYECGPGQQLKAMIKRIDLGMWKSVKNSSV